MVELDALIINKQTFNTAYISFNKKERAKKWMNVLIRKKIPHTSYILFDGIGAVYTFKMYRIKKRVFELAIEVKEVVK